MKRYCACILFSLPLLLLLSCPTADDAGIQTLKNDGWASGGTAVFIDGINSGEEAAATFGPVSQLSKITKVQFLFGDGLGGTVNRNIILHIYLDTGATNPSTEIYTTTYNITGSDTALQEVDLSSENLLLSSGTSFRVSIEMTAFGLPSIARDDDGSIQSGRNWFYVDIVAGLQWYAADDAPIGQLGDFIIRTTIEAQ